MFEIVLFPCPAWLLMLLFSFLWIRKCVCMLWVCSGLTGALEKPAVSGGCWTAVLTWLLVYLQQYWGQGFINLRVKRKGLFSPQTALHLRCWPANAPLKMQPPQTPGRAGQDRLKGERLKYHTDQPLPKWRDAWCAVLCLISNWAQLLGTCWTTVRCLSSNEFSIATY